MMSTLALALTVSLVGFCSSSWAAADSIVAYAKGARQGVLAGEITAKGKEGSTAVLKLQQETQSAQLPASAGAAVGKKVHAPLVFAHPFGTMAVQLLQAANTNEILNDVTIRVFAVDPARGAETLQTTIKLTDAVIVEIKTVAAAPAGGALQLTQELSLSYRRMEVTDARTGIVATDDWPLGSP